MDSLKSIPNFDFVTVDPKTSTITFKLQDGPIKEVGVNGCQVHEMLRVWLSIVQKFNVGQFACRQNSISITKVEEALMWQDNRTAERILRGVEGYNKG